MNWDRFVDLVSSSLKRTFGIPTVIDKPKGMDFICSVQFSLDGWATDEMDDETLEEVLFSPIKAPLIHKYRQHPGLCFWVYQDDSRCAVALMGAVPIQ